MMNLQAIKKVLYVVLTLILYHANLKAQGLINQTSFENWPDEHEYVQNDWVADGFQPRWVSGFGESRCFIDDAQARSGTKSLRVLYPAGGVGPAETGAQTPLGFEGKDEVYMSYWLRFSENFDWGRSFEGGKLPGFGSGDNCSGGETCDGTNGFTTRLMWRTDGKAVLYLYHMDKPGTYGEDIDLIYKNNSKVYFEKGVWYQVAQRVKINSGNNKDGEVDIWINGEMVLSINGIRLVNDGSKVDNLYFSTFHGGSGVEWAPSVDCHIWFDDIIISTDKNDVLSSEYSYMLDVNSGSGSGVYAPGTIVTIEADTTGGRIFEQWYGDTASIEDVYSQTTTISMPSAYTKVSAKFVNDVANLLINGEFSSGILSPWSLGTGNSTASASVVEGEAYIDIVSAGADTWEPQMTQTGFEIKCGNTYSYSFDAKAEAERTFVAGVNEGAPGYSSIHYETVNLTTSMQHYEFEFTSYISDNDSRFDLKFGANNSNITIDNVVLGNTTINNGTYELNVAHGTGSGKYDENNVVCISADDAPIGKKFDKWAGDITSFDDINSTNTTMTMPGGDVSIEATYADINFTLTVNSGTGDGSYTYGAEINIVADTAPSGKEFYQWVGDDSYIADVHDDSTTFTMPASNATITAEYTTITNIDGTNPKSYSDNYFYPNPTDKLLHVNYNGNYSVTIYTISGILLKSSPNLSGKQTLDLSELKNGVFLINLKSEHEQIMRRLCIR